MRQWLWALSLWNMITAMEDRDKGVAVSLSLGGRAARIAESMNPAVLNRRDGLYQLLRQLHYYLGAEAQDKQRHAYKQFERYRRQRGASASEHILEFERLYHEIVSYGMFLPRITLSMKLIESASLSESQEAWVLQAVGGDYSRYHEIRLALKRLPSLDHRHYDSGHYPMSETPNPQLGSSMPYQPFANNNALNKPPPEPQQDQAVFDGDTAYPTDQWYEDDEDDSDSDDDYVSSCASDIEDEAEAEGMVQTFAITRRKRSAFWKKTGKRFYRKGHRRTRKTWMLDTKRNLSDQVPTGWDRAKWLKRVPCPSCGSRYHRNCQNQNANKSYPAFRRRRGKGNPKGGGKGNHKGGVGTWATFLVTGASMFQSGAAASFMTCQPCNSLQESSSSLPFEVRTQSSLNFASVEQFKQPLESWIPDIASYEPDLTECGTFVLEKDVTDMPTMSCFHDCLDESEEVFFDCAESLLFERPATEQLWLTAQVQDKMNSEVLSKRIPAQIPQQMQIFHIYHLSAYLKEQNESNAYFGIEPFDCVYRVRRYQQLKANGNASRLRFAFMLDTGAPSSCIGRKYLRKFVSEFSLEDTIKYVAFHANLSGIGAGSAPVREKAIIPIGLCSSHMPIASDEIVNTTWTAQVLDGVGDGVPPLLGLDSMIQNQSIIDMTKKPPQLSFSHVDGRRTLDLDVIGGHLVLPIDWGGKPLPDQETFYYEALGSDATFIIDDDMPYDVTDDTNLLESSESLGPDNPLQTMTKTSAIDCPPYSISSNDNTTYLTRTELLMQRTDKITSDTHANIHTLPVNQLDLPTRASTKRKKDLVSKVSKISNSNFSRRVTFVEPPLETVITGTVKIEKQAETDSTSLGLGRSVVHQSELGPVRTEAYTTQQHNVRNMKAAKLTKSQQDFLMENATYRRKYKPLPADTPPPDVSGVEQGRWDIWELWSGTGKWTKHCKQLGLKAGPPVSHETGWDLLLPTHQEKLKELLLTHKPRFIHAAPLCSPWSTANTTMDHSTKELIQKQQLQAFEFFVELCVIQHRHGRGFGVEQPAGSSLLRTKAGLKLLELGAVDSMIHMCQHDLKDPVNHKPVMKPTIVRATHGVISANVARKCPGNHEHQQLQGRLPGTNKLRTAVAQEYTKPFCCRYSSDVKRYIRGIKNGTFPIEQDNSESDEPIAEDDPYPEIDDDDITKHDEDARIQKAIEEAKARRTANPRTPAPSTPPPMEFLKPKAKSLPQPSTPSTTPLPNQTSSSSSSVRPQQQPQESHIEPVDVSPPGAEPDGEADEQVQVHQPLAVDPLGPIDIKQAPDNARRTTVEKTAADLLSRILTERARLAPGNAFTISVPSKLKTLQELFGTPHGKTIKLAVLARKPKAPATPEPVVSRLIANLCMRIVLDTADGTWTRSKWQEYTVVKQKYQRPPEWECTLFGLNTEADSLAEQVIASPLETVAEQQELDVQNTTSLTGVLKTLCESDSVEKQIAVILALHKRLYHRKAEELTTLLTRAGIPSRHLTRIKEAVDRCEYCRRWSQIAAKPSIKTRISARFNELVYCDIVYLDSPPTLHMVCVDDCIRVTTVWYIEFRDFTTLEQAFRHSWLRRFGPPSRLRSDKEGALSSEQFAAYCEKLNITLELVTAGEHHGFLGPLDRRVKIIRLHAPILLDLLAQECLSIDHADLSAELELDLNTGLSYAGVTPYQCLYGMNPRPIFNDEFEGLSAYSDCEPFYEMQQIRLKSTQAFQQALLRYRVQKATSARPRKDNQQLYKVGDIVDIYRRPKHRDLQGWRGPATIIQLLGEGMVCVRWQSMVLDVPVHMIRPHIQVTLTKALPTAVQNPFRKMIEEYDKEEEVSEKERKEIEALDKALDSDQDTTSFVFFSDQIHRWETFYNEEIADQLKGDYTCLDTLVSLTASMPLGSIQIHSVDLDKTKGLKMSREAERDQRCIWKVGNQLSHAFDLPNYFGIVLTHGRRHIPHLRGVNMRYLLVWTNSTDHMQQIALDGEGMVDLVLLGFPLENINDTHCICMLNTTPSNGNMLQQLIDKMPFEEMPMSDTGRLREEIGDTVLREQSELASTTIVSRLPSTIGDTWDENLTEPEVLAMTEKGITPTEYWQEAERATRYKAHARSNREKPKEPSLEHLFSRFCGNGTDTNVFITMSELKDPMNGHGSHCLSDECFFMFDSDVGAYFPLDKDTRPLTEEEIKLHADEIEKAMLKELASWIQHSAGKPVRKKEYEKRTGLKALPSRWLIEWKRKEGQRIIKCRLVLKGFAERNQDKLQTRSPTASRTGHRTVHQTAATRKWTLASLDISTAFLQGFRFEDLPEGVNRQPCGFTPPKGVFQLLAKLAPDTWSQCVNEPDEWTFELHKSAYGLKDAPLMWYIAINAYLRELSASPTSHDGCVYKRWNKETKQLDLLLSLHVDDTLITGRESDIDEFAKRLEQKFGKISYQKGSFTHFGLDTTKCPQTHNVTLCQKNYLAQIKQIEVDAKRGSGRTLETKANAEEITQFRSVVSAIAWLAQTYPPAGTAASLYQSRLPEPTIGDLRQLNTLLDQLKECYRPMIIRGDVDYRDCLIVALSDASLGNASKHSQIGYVIALTNRVKDKIIFPWSIMSYKSQKSKRVATSTLHSELLGQSAAAEEAVNLQTFIYELEHPELSANELVQVDPSLLCPIWGITDCNDLHDTLVKSTQPVLTNKSMTLFVEALREYKAEGRIQEYCWCDTRDNIANVLTKLKPDGCLELDGITNTFDTATWKPKHLFKVGTTAFATS